jgi:hypothetical protein
MENNKVFIRLKLLALLKICTLHCLVLVKAVNNHVTNLDVSRKKSNKLIVYARIVCLVLRVAHYCVHS